MVETKTMYTQQWRDFIAGLINAGKLKDTYQSQYSRECGGLS